MNFLRLAFAALMFSLTAAGFAAEKTSQELFRDAVGLFFDAKPVESARVFDQLVMAVPGRSRNSGNAAWRCITPSASKTAGSSSSFTRP